MADNLITCPECKASIRLSDALSQPILEQAKRDAEKESAKALADIAEKKKALEGERERIEKDAVRKAEEKNAVEKRDLQLRLQEQSKKIEEAQRTELDMRKRQRELEDKEREMAIRVQREMDQQRKQIEEQLLARVAQENHQKELEAAKRDADYKKTIDELKRKMEQGSQQAQGEVVELEIENLLRALFQADQIEPVAKGIRGADVVQRVFRNGKPCGTIIWELKQTKAWSDGWIDKLKDDQRQAKADVAVLVSAVRPKGVGTFTQQNGVWITSQACLPSLASTLRWALVQHAMARSLAEGTQGKMKALYEYLSGPEFKQRVEAIFDASDAMREQLDRERRLYLKNWSEREKLIGRVGESLLGMHGDLQGLGASLEHIGAIDGEVETLDAPVEAPQARLSRSSPAATERPGRASVDFTDEDDSLF